MALRCFTNDFRSRQHGGNIDANAVLTNRSVRREIVSVPHQCSAAARGGFVAARHKRFTVHSRFTRMFCNGRRFGIMAWGKANVPSPSLRLKSFPPWARQFVVLEDDFIIHFYGDLTAFDDDFLVHHLLSCASDWLTLTRA